MMGLHAPAPCARAADNNNNNTQHDNNNNIT